MNLTTLFQYVRRFDKRIGLIVISWAAFASPLQAEGLRVDNFVLLDQHGAAHELRYDRDVKAVVLISHGNGCQVIRSSLPDYQQLRDYYQDKGVELLMINSNLQDDRDSIAAEAAEWGIDFPILDDRAQIIGRSLQVKRTNEVLVIDPRNWEVVYRGPVNDRVDYERQKSAPSQYYVREAVDAILAGKTVPYKKIASPGCIINFDEYDETQITYSETIAPLLKENCTACHIKGGIAPWAMSDYTMVKGFAPMIREVVRTRRMPPWHADPEVGHWANNAGLSDDEIAQLIQWVEAGAPRGDGPDPLTEVAPLESSWALGEPDLVIDIPEFEVPATGIVDYQFPAVANPLDRDVWIVGAAIIPGDPKAVHHIIAGAAKEPPQSNEVENIFENFILAYAPGNEGAHMPEGTGVLVPKGGVFQFQMHYTPYGRKTIDRSRIGLYFADKPPANFYREHVILNPWIRIPANTEAHQEQAYFDFSEDAIIYALAPHSHYRGKSSVFELEYPDGEKELVLSVPDYDFNWQRTYEFVEPKQVPAGTRLVHRTVYDNSSNNPGNPDPDSEIRWGLQSHEEMLYGSIGFSWVNETTDRPTHDPMLAEAAQQVGFMDRNMDGVVSKAEMPPRMLQKLEKEWAALDTDSDDALSLKEMTLLVKSQQQQAGSGSPGE